MINDLSPEMIAAANVDNNKPTEDVIEVEKKIAKAVKGYTFSMPITAAQYELLTRFSTILGMDWKTYLRQEIEAKILRGEGAVGAPLINGPSFAGKKIGGPSK